METVAVVDVVPETMKMVRDNSGSQKKNRIQVSNTKKPLFFYVNLAKKYMQQHDVVELSALGMESSRLDNYSRKRTTNEEDCSESPSFSSFRESPIDQHSLRSDNSNRKRTKTDSDYSGSGRSLNLLRESPIDRQSAKSDHSSRKRTKREKMKWMERPRLVPDIILELQDESSRESALRCLGHYLIERRVEHPDNYNRIGYLLFHSCGTMSILLQEVLVFLRKMAGGCLDARICACILNVLILFQSVAANAEVRQNFVDCRVPNFLIPLVLFKSSLDEFENTRAVALSVIGILCQARDPQVTEWAIESKVVEMCRVTLVHGSKLAKVISLHILEALLQVESGISYICGPSSNMLLTRMMKTWGYLTNHLALDEDLCPRLFFHIIRCFILLCNHISGFEVVRDNLPNCITDGSFHNVAEKFPVIKSLLHQLLLIVGKTTEVPDP